VTKINKNDEIQDEIVRHQVRIIQLGQGLGEKANDTISQTEKELAAAIAIALLRITDSPTKANLERLASLERRIRKIRQVGFDQAEYDTNQYMINLAENESDWITKILLAITGLAFIPLTSVQIERITSLIPFAGRTPGQWWTSALDSDINRIMTIVRSGVQNGLNHREIVNSIIGTKTTPRALKSTENEVNAISRTVTTGVSNAAQDSVIKKNEGFDRVLWVSILDSRTSAICRGLSGQTWKIDEPYPTPPAHSNCRSTLTYLLTDDPMPEDPSYNDWIRKQPEEFQRDVLPKWQYEAMKKGTPLKAFISKDLKPLTMEEFKKKQ